MHEQTVLALTPCRQFVHFGLWLGEPCLFMGANVSLQLSILFADGAGVRLAVFDGAKKLLVKANQAYKEEVEKQHGGLYRLR